MAEAVADRGEVIAPQTDSTHEIGPREALWLAGRAFEYIWPFRWRFLGKWLFTLGGILPILYVPWPAKVLIDHVIRGRPIDESASRYPPYFDPFVRFIDGMPPFEMLMWLTLLGAVMVILVGTFGQGSGATDRTDGGLAEGHDTATRTENEANIGFSFASGIYGLIEFRWQLRLSQALNHYYRSKLFERIKTLPMVTLDDQRIGDTIYRVMYDTPMITRLCYDLVLVPTLAVLTFLIVVGVMHFSFGRAPEVVWCAAAVFPLYFFATLPFAKLARRRSSASRTAGSTTTGTIEEGMSNILAVQSLGGWKRERSRFDGASRESFKRYRGLVWVNVMVASAVSFAGELMIILIFLIISGQIIEGTFSVGDYAVVFFYYFWMAGAASTFAQMWIRLQDNVAGVRRVFWLMDLESEVDQGTRQLGPIREGVKLEHASLVYPDGRQALDDVSLEARVGEIVAIVGPTGAGKTSLAYLLPRFHRATEGRVLIDDQDVDELALESLRPQVSYVFQETHLFSDSVTENIRYGNADATQEDVERAARIAGAHDFITQLPQGYDTQLGQRGSKLSVGQKQRIAIARGLLRDARILILDEPTSALDPETEQYLVNSLQEARRDHLVIIIAHRLSTIAHADKVIFMQDGKIVERGSPAELMANPDSAYRRYVRLQTAHGQAD